MSRNLILKPLAWIGGVVLLVTLAACGEPPDTHPGQPVTKRKAAFKQILRNFEPMGMVTRGRKDYDSQEFQNLVTDLLKLADQPWPYFTPESNYAPTRAKAEVWTKPGEFKQAQERFQKAASALATAARSNSLDVIKPAFAELEKSCQSCHQDFRGKPL